MNLTARKLAIQKQYFLGNSVAIVTIQKTILLLRCLVFDLGKQKEFSRLWAGENWARFLVLLNSGAGFIIIMIRWPFNCRVILYQKVEKNQHNQRIFIHIATIGCVVFIVDIPICFSKLSRYFSNPHPYPAKPLEVWTLSLSAKLKIQFLKCFSSIQVFITGVKNVVPFIFYNI